ncbi:MAG: hypothetical protein ABF289_03065 [Clostridiales bacterium]
MNKISYFLFLLIMVLIIILILISKTTSPNYPWYIHTTYGLLWIPLTIFYIKSQKHKLFSILGSTITCFYIVLINYIDSPTHLWFLYVIYVLLWWPISIFFNKYLNNISFSIIGSIITILYYLILNLLISNQHPWVIYVTFTIMWWPIFVIFTKKKNWLGISVVGSINLILLFIISNFINSPKILWFIYPTFAILWWPLSVYFYVYRKNILLNQNPK